MINERSNGEQVQFQSLETVPVSIEWISATIKKIQLYFGINQYTFQILWEPTCWGVDISSMTTRIEKTTTAKTIFTVKHCHCEH